MFLKRFNIAKSCFSITRMYNACFARKYKSAFSLVEMLMTLLVASLLLAALAPVMTKKFVDNLNVSVSGGVVPNTYCIYSNDTTEDIVSNEENTACLVPDNTYSASAIIASGGGGGGGAASSAEGFEENLSLTSGFAEINWKMKSLKVKIRGGSGSAGSGVYAGITAQTYCKNYTGGSVCTYDSANDVCVAKTEGNAAFNNASTKCANLPSLNAFNWTLPSTARLANWNSDLLSALGITNGTTVWSAESPVVSESYYCTQYCFKYSGSGEGCWSTKTGCETDRNAHWGGQASNYPCYSRTGYYCSKNVTKYAYYSYSNSAWNSGIDASASTLRSVYCTTALDKSKLFASYSGGRPTSGTYLEINVPDKVMKAISLALSEGKTSKIHVYPAASVNGGKAPDINGTVSTNGKDGNNGNPSKILITIDNVTVWMLNVPGGYKGYGALIDIGNNTANIGKNGNITDSENTVCRYYDKFSNLYNSDSLNGSEVLCKNIPDVIASSIEYPAVTADVGGGICTEENNVISCSNGSAGKDGIISVAYKPTYPGIGGGGGAAGTVLHLKNFQVRPKDLIKVQTGKKGRGGSSGTNGDDGGTSYIELANGIKFEVLGGGGGNAGIQGNPNNNILPKAGEPGIPSALSPSTKSRLSLKDEYFPVENIETQGTKGIESVDMMTSAGGNGGVNFKISTLIDSKEGTPCGGKSTMPVTFKNEKGETIEWQCNNTSNIPLPLSRVLSVATLDVETLTNLAPGSTGGGGGGWDINNSTSAASGGADGLGGYVIIYFGKWGE